MSAALDPSEVSALLAPVAGARSIALAVSGGGDSLALLLAVDRWRREADRPAVHVVTVDHGLAAGSAEVAARVAGLAEARGLAVRTLHWEGPKPIAAIEAEARRARYRLLAEAARQAGASHLLTAHSLEDQAETFVMRLGRGSGVFGLAAMRAETDLDGLVLFRPFLAVPRARLVATVAAAGLAPHEDPMNADPRFERVRVRRLLPILARAGLTAPVLVAAAARCAGLASEVEDDVDRLVADAVTVDAFAVVTVRRDAFASVPAMVRDRLLVRLLQAIGGGDYPPRAEALGALCTVLSAAGQGASRRTLAGVVIERGGKALRLWREFGRSGLPMLDAPPGFIGTWDGRYRVSVPEQAPGGLKVGALGTLRPVGLERSPGLPAGAKSALPAVFEAGRLVAIPALGWSEMERGPVDIALRQCLSDRIASPARFPHLAATS